MDHDRLCSWLGLPAGSWPPDHYALLGLTRGAGDVTDVEARVLDRMEQIRPHQLLHPELVTEGMNRLAQALVCLTDPVARAEYDRLIGIPTPPFEVVEDEALPEAEELPPEPRRGVLYDEVARESGTRPPRDPQRPAYEVVPDREPEPDPLPYLPYEVIPPKPPPLPATYKVLPPDEVREPELIAAEVVEPFELPRGGAAPAPGEARDPSPPQPGSAATPTSRRAVYRRLAAVRKALRAWNALRPVFGTPTEALGTPISVLLFVQALAGARDALPGVSRVIGEPGSPGGVVAALVRLPHVLHAIRLLLAEQREAVALDWHRGYEALRREQFRLREMASAARPRPRDPGVQLLHTLRRTPEWLLLVAAFVAMLLALLRRNS